MVSSLECVNPTSTAQFSHQILEEPQISPCLQSSEEIKVFSLEDFKNMGLLSEKGKIRLLPSQRWFNENEEYFPVLPQLYESWRDESEYLLFRQISENPMFLALKCSKRGNDVYRQRIKRRFAFLHKSMEDSRFFSPEDFRVDKAVKTRVLWLTLTWNTRLFSIRKSWNEEVGKAWNRFISALRRRYGKVSVLRSFEATKRGFPHVHAILVFETSEFSVFPHLNEENKLTYRIKEKAEFESLWHSFVDVEAFPSMRKAVYYALKYQLKVNEGREEETSQGKNKVYGSKSMAFMWLFRKRSYAVSGSFREIFHRLDVGLHNSNMGKAEAEAEKWELVGVFSGKQLGLHDEWVAEIPEERLTGLIPDGDWRVEQGVSYGES